jgi:phosphatidylcholine synthase
MRIRQIAAASVHVYTSLGLVMAFIAFLALREQNVQFFLIAMWAAALIDGTDGFLARRLRVKQLLPGFDGRKLDDIVDYLMYVFLPVMGMVQFGILQGSLVWIAILPLLASAYGFCQERAKTSESFVGFPSYWNVLFGYLYFLALPEAWSAAIIAVLAVLVFVPVEYIYPTQTRMLKRLNITLAFVWAAVVWAVILNHEASWAQPLMLASLAFPAYYMAASLINHFKLAQVSEGEPG